MDKTFKNVQQSYVYSDLFAWLLAWLPAEKQETNCIPANIHSCISTNLTNIMPYLICIEFALTITDKWPFERVKIFDGSSHHVR